MLYINPFDLFGLTPMLVVAAFGLGTLLLGKAVRKDKPHIPKYNLKVKLWVSDDDRRIIIKAVTQIRLGEAAIELQSYTPPKLKRRLLSNAQPAESCTLYADK